MNGAETALWPFVVYFVAVLLLVATMLGLSWVLGQRRASRATNMPFESGVLSVGSPQIQLSVEFYLVAIFFVDIASPWIFFWAYVGTTLRLAACMAASADSKLTRPARHDRHMSAVRYAD